MRFLPLVLLFLSAIAVAAQDNDATTAPGSELRVLDKLTGETTDLSLTNGESETVGYLTVTLNECRYPSANPAGDAYASLMISYRGQDEPVFTGWMLASAPALSAMDHPRYDVWPLRCMTS